MTNFALVCEHVSKTFSQTPAVNDLHLEVASGDFLALLGPSGCGKTTSLRLIAGLESPTRGTIRINGKLVAGDGVFLAAHQRRVGLVFQDYALFPHMDVQHNVAYGLQGNRAEKQNRIAEVLQLTGLTGLEKRYPHELSGGQQQRVALARALAPQPSLLLLDEPFSNLDAGLRTQVREEVRRIVKSLGVTTILVTHDQEEAFSLADYVSVMLNGNIQQTDTPATIYQRPATPAIARFIGDANLLQGNAQGREVETILGKHTLQTPHQGRVEVLIRPEAITISTEQAPNAEVVSINYFGHDQLVTLRLMDDGTMVESRCGHRLKLTRNQKVALAVEGETLAYPTPI